MPYLGKASSKRGIRFNSLIGLNFMTEQEKQNWLKGCDKWLPKKEKSLFDSAPGDVKDLFGILFGNDKRQKK